MAFTYPCLSVAHAPPCARRYQVAGFALHLSGYVFVGQDVFDLEPQVMQLFL